MTANTTQATTRSDEHLQEDFKEAFKRLAATVTVISYHTRDGHPAGMTAVSVCSLSLMPLSLLVCVNRGTTTHDELEKSEQFGVNVLSFGQERIAEFCSRPGEFKALPSDWLVDNSPADTPVIENSLAQLDCRVAKVYPESTHSIFIGNVRNVWLGPAVDPLLYSNRTYRQFNSEADAEAFQTLWDRIAFGALS